MNHPMMCYVLYKTVCVFQCFIISPPVVSTKKEERQSSKNLTRGAKTKTIESFQSRLKWCKEVFTSSMIRLDLCV